MSVATAKPRPVTITHPAERCICLNDACDNREIPRDHVFKKINPEDRTVEIVANCTSCGRWLCMTRPMDVTNNDTTKIEWLTDPKRIEPYAKKLRYLQGA